MHQMNNINKSDAIVLERKLISARLIACFLCITAVNTVDYFDSFNYYNLGILLYILYNLALWLYSSLSNDSKLFVVSVYIDIFMITMLIALRGGINSDLYGLYFLVLTYIVSKKQKYLIISATLLISLLYPFVCILFTDMDSYVLRDLISRIITRVTLLLMSVSILFNIKTKMNYSNMLSHKAYEMALIDPLTKVYNRNMLETLNEYRKSHPDCISFAMIDIDDFKVINDTFGHQKGDKILRMLGDLIKKSIRNDDICIRYGGEEFLLAFKNTDNETALKILERIKSSFCEHIFYCGDKPMFCTISAGLALGNAYEENEIIISYADNALYQAKRNGKNNIMTYSNAS
jgi:diguanylate cyclase (GGDEF)-like protein